MIALPATAASLFLIAAAPICFFVAYSDLSRLKIPNVAVAALCLSYAVLGFIALPIEQYLAHWIHLLIVLLIGFIFYAIGAMGAGDAKFAAAIAPMVAAADLSLVCIILTAIIFASLITHKIAKHSPLRRLTPTWESWSSGKKFPMGFPMAGTLITYLILAATTGP